MSQAMEDKQDQIHSLISMGKERGYVLYDELNDVLPSDVHSSEEIEDLISVLEQLGISLSEDASTRPARAVARTVEVQLPSNHEADEAEQPEIDEDVRPDACRAGIADVI